MDTLSSSVTTLKLSSLHPGKNELYHFKSTPYAPNRCSPHTQAHVSSISTPSLVPKTNTFSPKSPTPLVFSSSRTSSLNQSSPIFHRKPATGYAAALIDVAQRSNCLRSVQNDVQRLSKLLRNLNFQLALQLDTSSVQKGMRELVEKERFHRHVEALLKILARKGKMEIVHEVFEEFERIYDEMCGTQVVLVSSATKIGDDQLFGIARSVHKLSGAAKVKVKNLVHERFPSYAI
ncbi:hypothetical protein L6164_004067 [Bauhinia variegata]|uniref:Uncharacterized protein n=1 Tax=Bauhinia variegata TaxID=167791 RepID=A0ACB9Q3G6_BAUVA|nr:hypothetical protein L6164_004067 [Bauhinia variegata]